MSHDLGILCCRLNNRSPKMSCLKPVNVLSYMVKRNFADVNKLKILQQRDILKYPVGQCNVKSPYKREAGGLVRDDDRSRSDASP